MSGSSQRPFTVLVVEDEWLVRDTVASYLRSAHCQVVEAASGEAAAEVLQQRNGVDVVFTDIRLAGPMNGWDVGEVSRSTHPDIPVIYTSGATVTPERPVAGSVFLPKPYDPEKVLDACRSLVRSWREHPFPDS